MMARIKATQKVTLSRLLWAIAPFIAVQVCVIAAVFAVPQLVHLLDAPASALTPSNEANLDAQMRAMSEIPAAGSSEAPNQP
jgi:hypothetical protein